VLEELMAEEVDDVVGPKGKHNAERTAVRRGHEAGGNNPAFAVTVSNLTVTLSPLLTRSSRTPATFGG
jgi:hypothetical protein